MTKDYLKETLFIDIETAGIAESYDKLNPKMQELWDAQIFRDEDVTAMSPADRYAAKAGLRAEFAKVICISLGAIIFKDETSSPTLYVKSIVGEEKDILSKFATATLKYKRLAAHNGKGFDFGFICRRSLINGLSLPSVLNTQGKKPWEIENIDTQDLWRFGDQSWPSLELLSTVLGIEVGNSLEGKEINAAFYAGKIKDISTKCSNDVAAMVRVFVKLNDPNLDVGQVTFA